MADDALQSFTTLTRDVPGWIAELEEILRSSTDRQHALITTFQPIEHDGAATSPETSARDSFRSSPPKEELAVVGMTPSALGQLRPQIPHMSSSDALRLSQRKRKTASVCSGEASSSIRQRKSRSMAIVYFDGDVQKSLEKLVRAVGSSRNSIRKGKMSAKVDSLSRTGSSGGSSSDGSRSSGDDAPRPSTSLSPRSCQLRGISRAFAVRDEGVEAFDNVDGWLDKAQTSCERAAYQMLRDGNCALEVKTTTEYLTEAVKSAEAELPTLQERADIASASRKRSEERRRLSEQTDDAAMTAKIVDVVATVFSANAKLEVDDIEIDDESDDADDFVVPTLRTGNFSRDCRTRLAVH